MENPLVNIQKAMERSTMLLMGKSTISMVIFNSYVNVYQRVVERIVVGICPATKQVTNHDQS